MLSISESRCDLGVAITADAKCDREGCCGRLVSAGMFENVDGWSGVVAVAAVAIVAAASTVAVAEFDCCRCTLCIRCINCISIASKSTIDGAAVGAT